MFAIRYLVLHGLIKLALVWALLRKVLPAYPVALAVLGTFSTVCCTRPDRWSGADTPLEAAGALPAKPASAPVSDR